MKLFFKAFVLLMISFVLFPAVIVLAQGTVLADTGFRPQQNGFSFANYGNETKPVNLTSASMQKVFGDRVCKAVQDGTCVLTATAQAWMEKINNDMNGGHCEGMAALSKLIYTGQVSLQSLDPNAQSIADLKPDNPRVQEEIARWFATQYVPPTATAEIRDQTPSQVVDTLVERLQSGTGPFTMGIYEAGGSGGHAITPYSVVDMGNGIARVMVYDNNYPGEERFIEVNKTDNTWKYTGSTNPNEPATTYSGTAASFSLTLTPAAARTTLPQECNFCKPDDGGITTTGTGGTATTTTDQSVAGDEASGAEGTGTSARNSSGGCNQTAVMTGPNTDLIVTTEDGHKAGVINGQAFSNIEGALVLQPRSQTGLADDTPGAVVIVPKDTSGNLALTFNGEGGDDVLLTSCGQYQQVQGLSQADGEADTLVFNPETNTITGEIDPDETLNLGGGYDNPTGDDFMYSLANVQAGDGSLITIGADPNGGGFSFESSGDVSFDVTFASIDIDGNTTENEFTDFGNAGGEGFFLDVDNAVYNEAPEPEFFEADTDTFDAYAVTRDEDEGFFDELQNDPSFDGSEFNTDTGEGGDAEGEGDGGETEGDNGSDTGGDDTSGDDSGGEETGDGG